MRAPLITPTGSAPDGEVDAEPAPIWDPIPANQRACCCSAHPAYQAVLATDSEGRTVDLLFCGHHFRASRERLVALGAALYDRAGNPL